MKSAWYTSVSGGNTGSRSRRAQIAEINGKEPATRAAKTWGFKSGSALRQWIRACEWHHVGKYAAAIDYFDVKTWIEDMAGEQIISFVGLSSVLTSKGKELVLRPLIKSCVSKNLAPSDPYNIRSQNSAGYFKRGYPRPKSQEEAIRRNQTKRIK